MTETSRYDQLDPIGRALVDDYDEIDLAAMLDTAQDELAALRAVSGGYCPACGRGDCSPTADQWYAQRQRADRAEAALAHVQALVAEYPAGIDTALIEEALDTQTGPATTEATDTPNLAERIHTAIESEIYEYRERTMWWEETGGVTEEIARLATRGAMEVRDKELARVRTALGEILNDAFHGMRNSDNTGPIDRYRACVTPGEYDTWQAVHRGEPPGL
jgi:hypothetical protein